MIRENVNCKEKKEIEKFPANSLKVKKCGR